MSDSLTSLLPGAGAPAGDEVVKAREFDLTQVVKKLTVAIPLLMAAIVGALKAIGVEEATDPPYVVAGLGVTAFAVLSLGLVSAADILGRAYVEGKATSTGAPENAGDQQSKTDRERDDRLDKERQDRDDRLDKDRQEREDRLEKERQDRDDRLAKERTEREDRLERERQDRRDRIESRQSESEGSLRGPEASNK